MLDMNIDQSAIVRPHYPGDATAQHKHNLP